VLSQTGAQKVNIIAHSKGGLDCRYAIANLGLEDKVA
jgi:triacylglycerol lipase